MADLANVVVKGEFDGQELIAGLKEVSKLGKKAATDSDLLNRSMGKLSNVMSILGSDVKNALGVLSRGFDTLGKKLDDQSLKFDKYATAVKNAKRETSEFSKVQKQAAGMADKMLGNTSRGAAQANRFNSANFLAQFQDIAVTSAMGMNPMLIAMQQGTQLQYILAQSNAPLKDFVAGLKSMFSVTGMLAIGLTGVIAALIQLVDWSKLAQNVLNGFATAFTWLGDKLNLSFLTSMGAYFRDLADDIGLAKGALDDWNNALLKIDLELENKEFEQSIEGLSLYEREYKKAFRRLQLEFAEQKSKLMAKGGTEADVSRLELEMARIPEEAKRIAERNVKIEETAEARKKEKKALEDVAKAASVEAKSMEKLAEAWDKLNLSAQNKINDLVTQRELIGAGSYEKTYVQTLNDAMRQAQGAGIDLYSTTANGQTVIQVLNENAQATAALTEENERLNASYEFSKSTVKGFFSEMRVGLRDGQSAWEAFGNAVNSVLDKILDKIMDIGVDALFSAGRNYFGTSAMGFGGMFGGLTSGTTSTGIGGLQVGQSAGNLTYLGSVTAAANGGVFSNGVYSSPTLFKFGKGGKFGVMGEAGPEAVMPLTRGPDGSLGVRADGGSSSPVVVNVINNSNAQAKVEQRQTSQGMEIDVMIDQLVAEKMNQPGTSSNSALRAFSNQKLIAR